MATPATTAAAELQSIGRGVTVCREAACGEEGEEQEEQEDVGERADPESYLDVGWDNWSFSSRISTPASRLSLAKYSGMAR